MKLLKLFKPSKIIIHSTTYKPGVLVKTFLHGGKKYARISFPNLTKRPGFLPITDILFEDINAIRKMPSPALKWVCKKLHLKPK